ncbi:hypothetical protein T439DRAFT_312989 [Meredithblackwellia eburnea MCA 4105]
MSDNESITVNSLQDQQKFNSLVQEEIPIQTAAVNMQGGMPSCLTLFDNYLLCYSLAAQFKALYRFGQPQGCPAKFEDFKFCMSLKGVSDDKKKEAWIRRRAEHWAHRRMAKNSEDVWTARKNVYPQDGKQVPLP